VRLRRTIRCALDSLRSSALRTSALPSHRLLNYASGCAVQGLALRVTRRFFRGHDAAAHPSFSHAHVSLVSVRSGGLRQPERSALSRLYHEVDRPRGDWRLCREGRGWSRSHLLLSILSWCSATRVDQEDGWTGSLPLRSVDSKQWGGSDRGTLFRFGKGRELRSLRARPFR
jgi:hypothetical protein